MNEMNQKPSRFFPPSAQAFREQMDFLSAQIKGCITECEEIQEKLGAVSELKSELQALREEIERVNKELRSHVQCFQEKDKWLEKESSSVITKLDSIIGGISGIYQKDFPLNVQVEREYYKNFPTGPSPEPPTFQQDFLTLIEGLDEESVETVVLALRRIKIIQSSKDTYMDLCSLEEKRVMRHRVEHFCDNILEISDNCYFTHGYLLPVNHFEPSVFVDRCGLSWVEHPERLKDADIIDAGAFIGDSALIFSSITKGTVHAFEPVPDNYNLMLKTVEMNEISNIVPRPCALGENRGTATIFVNDSCSSQVKNQAFQYEGSIDADVTTIDEYVTEHNLRIGLIKADIEGAEQLMLKGAAETLRTQKPTLLISIYHNSDDFFKIKPMIEAMNLGYKFKIRHPVIGSVLTETILIAELP